MRQVSYFLSTEHPRHYTLGFAEIKGSLHLAMGHHVQCTVLTRRTLFLGKTIQPEDRGGAIPARDPMGRQVFEYIDEA